MQEGKTHKAKITTQRGTFEFEGSQEFIEKQIERIIGLEDAIPFVPPAQPSNSISGIKTPKQRSAGSAQKKAVSEQPKILTSLVVERDHIVGLKKIHADKQPANHVETFAVLTYWLKTTLGLQDASIDEIWTLYKLLQIKPPRHVMQTFRDGKSKRSFFEASGESGRYYLTSVGESFVEYDLPKDGK